MYQTDQFDSLLKQAVAIALTPVDEAAWKAANTSNGWKPGLPDRPKPGPYQPTGFIHFDALVRALPISLHYGANGPRTPVRDRSVLLACCDAPHGCRWMNVSPDDAWIALPNASDFDSPSEYAASLSHELIHWAEHHDPEVVLHDAMTNLVNHGNPSSGGLDQADASKLSGTVGEVDANDKALDAQVTDPVYVGAEMTAELGAMLLLAATGCDPNPAARGAYMQGYMGACPPMFHEQLMAVAQQRAKDAVAHLLTLAQGETP